MASAPVLVKSYSHPRRPLLNPASHRNGRGEELPPISAYAFADILRSADSPEVQSAIDGIAKLWSKSHLSLADEYASHLPPQGEITTASSAAVRPYLLRPGMRRALTSVPEASSSSSDGSRKKHKKRKGLFGFMRQNDEAAHPARRMKIGSMGRTLPVGTTTALATGRVPPELRDAPVQDEHAPARPVPSQVYGGTAALSLQRLLARPRQSEPD